MQESPKCGCGGLQLGPQLQCSSGDNSRHSKIDRQTIQSFLKISRNINQTTNETCKRQQDQVIGKAYKQQGHQNVSQNQTYSKSRQFDKRNKMQNCVLKKRIESYSDQTTISTKHILCPSNTQLQPHSQSIHTPIALIRLLRSLNSA